ncbi:MAG: AraC family transcriptional regulator [Sphingomonadales bacterium]|nr:MAG: AraC family transcriptional regulator [Sphingomonadales bacterium]
MDEALADGSGAPAARTIDRPLLHQKIFAPYKIATLIDTVADHGISAETVLAGTDLTAKLVQDPHTLTSIQDYVTACGNIIAAGAGAEVAFEIGSRLHLSAYGMYGYALMCSPTVRDFFDFAVRYHLLATPMQRLGWRQEGELAIWSFTETYREIMSPEVRGFLMRQQMMMTVTHVRDVAGTTILPERALFGLPDTGMGEGDARRLGCPCLYDMPAHELHYPARFLDQAPQFGNRLTHAWLQETCNGLLGEAKARTGIAGEIGQLLVMASAQPPTMPQIASQMGMTERTLRRRLESENISFAAIADDVRRRTALQYVETTRMNADDIASKLGFSDTANLRRAIKRWTGRTLSELRRPE